MQILSSPILPFARCIQSIHNHVQLLSRASFASNPTAVKNPNQSEELDTLYKSLRLEMKAHDPPVLQSYKKFILAVSEEFGIPFVAAEEPWRHIQKRELLKSRFVHKDHRAVYEWRTYFLNLQFKNLTGSTADTFLEYIERNLPEGVHMTVIKSALAKFPDHLTPEQAQATTE